MIEDEEKKLTLIRKLKDLEDKLIQYRNLVNDMLREGYTDKLWQDFQELRRDLQILYGGLENTIKEYGGPAVVIESNRQINAFTISLAPAKPNSDTLVALDASTHVVRKAIGKLELEKGSQSKGVDRNIVEVPRVFIAHGQQSARLRKLCDFLRALGAEPVVAEWSESEGCWIEEHVEKRMEESDCDIILAEYGSIIDVQTGARHPRLNVIDELARSRKKRPSRTILLLEKGVDLPSNVKGIVYEHFTKQNMEKAFIKVANELRAFGLIRAMKG